MTVTRLAWHISSAIATALLVATLVSPQFVTPLVPEDEQPRFDEPGAAARHDLLRRRPADERLDMPQLYDAAARRLSSLSRFSSRINRAVPAAQPQARVWITGDRAVSMFDRSADPGILDAWTPLGPGNIGGRTRVVRFHPTVPTTLFAAGVSGGIWKSDDNGTTWRPTGDGLTNIAINALAIDPARPDVMYAGTGEGYLREEIRGTGLPLRGAGIYMTTNGGRTWQQLPQTAGPDFHWVNDLELGVGDSRRIYAATRSGVWRSTDNGATWARLLEVNVRGGCLDLALRPDRTEDVLFASCGSYEQATVYRFPRAVRSIGFGSGAARTRHGPHVAGHRAVESRRHVRARGKQRRRGHRASIEQGLLAVYRSDRGGLAGSWQTRVNNCRPERPQHDAPDQPADDIPALVRNPDATAADGSVHHGLVQQRDRGRPARSRTGLGRRRRLVPIRRWRAQLGPGELQQQHAAVACPRRSARHRVPSAVQRRQQPDRDHRQRRRHLPDEQRAGPSPRTAPRAHCLGGAPIQVNWTSLNRGYGVTQFYHGVPFHDGTQYLAGAQDNGTILGSDAAGPDGWRLVFGGDGGFSAVHPTDTNTWLVEFQWASLGRTTNGGVTRSANAGPASTRSCRACSAPTAITCSLRRSRTTRCRTTSGSAATSSIGAPASARRGPRSSARKCLRPAASAPSRSHRRNNGDRDRRHRARPHRSHVEWRRRRRRRSSFPATRPRDGWVTSIAFDPRTPSVVYATYGNFGGAHVFRSLDGGATWQSIDGSGPTGVPDIPVHSIVVDPDDSQRLYLGTDLGVLVSIDGGRTLDDGRDRLRSGRHDVVVADADVLRREAAVRLHAWSWGVACATALRISSPRSCALRSPTP